MGFNIKSKVLAKRLDLIRLKTSNFGLPVMSSVWNIWYLFQPCACYFLPGYLGFCSSPFQEYAKIYEKCMQISYLCYSLSSGISLHSFQPLWWMALTCGFLS